MTWPVIHRIHAQSEDRKQESRACLSALATSSPFSQCIRRQVPSDVSGRVVGTAGTISAQTRLLCWSRATLCTAEQAKEATISHEGLGQWWNPICSTQLPNIGCSRGPLTLLRGSSTLQRSLSHAWFCSILSDPGWHLCLVKHRVEDSGTPCQGGGQLGKAPQCFSPFWTGEPVLGCMPLGWGGTSARCYMAGELWGWEEKPEEETSSPPTAD